MLIIILPYFVKINFDYDPFDYALFYWINDFIVSNIITIEEILILKVNLNKI